MPFLDRDELLAQTGQWMHVLGFRGDLGASMAEQIADFLVSHEPLTGPPVQREMSSEEKADARAIFEGTVKERSACYFCAGLHARVAGLHPEQQPCPRIKKLSRHTDGITVLDIEHWPPGEWEADVLFPSDVYEEDDE
jgi:hypothetical protein